MESHPFFINPNRLKARSQPTLLKIVVRERVANLSSLAGRAEHIRGLSEAAILIRSEEANFKEGMDYFEKLKAENAMFVN
jgi:hypothetical protein